MSQLLIEVKGHNYSCSDCNFSLIKDTCIILRRYTCMFDNIALYVQVIRFKPNVISVIQDTYTFF